MSPLKSISFLRKQQPIEFLNEDVEFKNCVVNPTDLAIDAAQIQYLIDLLPDGYRIVFVMYAIEGYKHYEIGKLLNISEGTSKSQLFKARKMLQQKILNLNTSSNEI